MISEQLLKDMSEVRQLLHDKGFQEKHPSDFSAGIGSTRTNGIPDILIYSYINGKHHVDICVHQNLKRRSAYASFVHYWGPHENQHDWGDGLSTIIYKLKYGVLNALL